MQLCPSFDEKGMPPWKNAIHRKIYASACGAAYLGRNRKILDCVMAFATFELHTGILSFLCHRFEDFSMQQQIKTKCLDEAKELIGVETMGRKLA